MEFVEKESAFRGRFKTYEVRPDRGDLEEVLEELRGEIVKRLKISVEELGGIKFQIFIELEYIKDNATTCGNLKTKAEILTVGNINKIEGCLDKAFEKLKTEKNECILKSSGHSFGKINSVELRINKYSPLL